MPGAHLLDRRAPPKSTTPLPLPARQPELVGQRADHRELSPGGHAPPARHRLPRGCPCFGSRRSDTLLGTLGAQVGRKPRPARPDGQRGPRARLPSCQDAVHVVFTVRPLRHGWAAISRLVQPWPTRRTASNSGTAPTRKEGLSPPALPRTATRLEALRPAGPRAELPVPETIGTTSRPVSIAAYRTLIRCAGWLRRCSRACRRRGSPGDRQSSSATSLQATR